MALFSDYRTDDFHDEMFAADGETRPVYRPLSSRLDRLNARHLDLRSALAQDGFVAQGITFSHEGAERAFPFDVLPRLIDAEEWQQIELGLEQRVRALDAFVRDVYRHRRAVHDGVIPNARVVNSRGFLREAMGITPPLGRHVHLAGIDLVRGGDGRWLVLEDNLRNPSGLSYVLQNRVFMRRVFPEAFSDYRVAPVGQAISQLRAALAAASPDGAGEVRIAVLTPGPENAAYYEHAFLAQQLGVPLVEGSDLVVRGQRLYMKTTVGRERVNVLYRRIDDDFLDPSCLRQDSLLGVGGLLQAYRQGNVAICNAPGNGVADDKSTYAYVPDLIRYYTNEEPILDQVRTFLLDRDDDREYALDHLSELVVKSVDGSGGYGILIGPHASPEEREAMARRVAADPAGYIAQETVSLSRAPAFIDGEFRPRHVDLRPFVMFGAQPTVVPGGLTRVALREGSLVVNSSQGGGGKDTWVVR